MMEFLRAGGIPIWIVMLFGLVAMVAAALYAWRPDEAKLGFFRGMSLATIHCTIGGVASCFAAVLWKVPARPEWAKSPELVLHVMTGFAESLTPAILGFTMLSLAWMMAAVGNRRLVSRLG